MMRRIYFEGQMIEISEQSFSTWLEGLAGGTHTLAEQLCHLQLGGFPDVASKQRSWVQKQLNQLESLISQIEDEELREMFQSLEHQLRKIAELDQQLVEVVAKFFKLPMPQTQQEHQKLSRKVNKYIAARGPVWVTQPEYQHLTQQTQQAFTVMEQTKQGIDDRLVQLFPGHSGNGEDSKLQDNVESITDVASNKEQALKLREYSANRQDAEKKSGDEWTEKFNDTIKFGDQRAKDLVDEAEGELDPRRAIKLFQRALRYGRTGIQASRAYLGLAIRYEDLGNERQAIKYYTKSIEAWQPSAIVLFWRGKIYYRQGRYNKARDDFKQAIAFLPKEALVSPERELAEKYLAELNQSSEKN